MYSNKITESVHNEYRHMYNSYFLPFSSFFLVWLLLVRLPSCESFFLFVRLTTRIPVCLSVSLSKCVCVCVRVCACVCLCAVVSVIAICILLSVQVLFCSWLIARVLVFLLCNGSYALDWEMAPKRSLLLYNVQTQHSLAVHHLQWCQQSWMYLISWGISSSSRATRILCLIILRYKILHCTLVCCTMTVLTYIASTTSTQFSSVPWPTGSWWGGGRGEGEGGNTRTIQRRSYSSLFCRIPLSAMLVEMSTLWVVHPAFPLPTTTTHTTTQC